MVDSVQVTEGKNTREGGDIQAELDSAKMAVRNGMVHVGA